jgi:hypothetical protein
MKNRKKFGRKSGRIILGYKDHLENFNLVKCIWGKVRRTFRWDINYTKDEVIAQLNNFDETLNQNI